MLPYLLLGVAGLFGLLLLARWFITANPKTLALVAKWVGGALAALVALYLIVSGRALHIFWLIVFLPVLLRMVRGFRGLGRTRPSPGQTSDVETEYLRMALDHDTGEMTGTVLKGAFAGRDLGDLGLDDLLALFEECLPADERSAQVLEAYLDRGSHAGWREAMDARRSASRRGGKAEMTPDEAREILGVGPEATAEEIKAAHRRLMQQNHPDRGGSTYLAAKINLAKEMLLGA